MNFCGDCMNACCGDICCDNCDQIVKSCQGDTNLHGNHGQTNCGGCDLGNCDCHMCYGDCDCNPHCGHCDCNPDCGNCDCHCDLGGLDCGGCDCSWIILQIKYSLLHINLC